MLQKVILNPQRKQKEKTSQKMEELQNHKHPVHLRGKVLLKSLAEFVLWLNPENKVQALTDSNFFGVNASLGNLVILLMTGHAIFVLVICKTSELS